MLCSTLLVPIVTQAKASVPYRTLLFMTLHSTQLEYQNNNGVVRIANMMMNVDAVPTLLSRVPVTVWCGQAAHGAAAAAAAPRVLVDTPSGDVVTCGTAGRGHAAPSIVRTRTVH